MDGYFGSTWYLRTSQSTLADCYLDWWHLDETMEFEVGGIYMLRIYSDLVPPDGGEDSEGMDVAGGTRTNKMSLAKNR